MGLISYTYYTIPYSDLTVTVHIKSIGSNTLYKLRHKILTSEEISGNANSDLIVFGKKNSENLCLRNCHVPSVLKIDETIFKCHMEKGHTVFEIVYPVC